MRTLFVRAVILLFALFCILHAYRCKAQQVIYTTPGYTSYWNPVNLIPDSVVEVLTTARLQLPKVPRYNIFHGLPDLARYYAHSGYDRGHNSSAEDNAFDAVAEKQSFEWYNMFPQRHILNAGEWERLEAYCRQLAIKYGTCQVVTSWDGSAGRLGGNGPVIPVYCTKRIEYAGIVERYALPNCDTVSKWPFTHYRVK